MAAQRDRAAYQYRAAVLTAFREVEDALAGQLRYAEQVASFDRVVTTARLSLVIAQDRYGEGYSDFLSLLDAQRTLFEAQQQRITAQADRLSAGADLAASLGGGFRKPAGGYAMRDHERVAMARTAVQLAKLSAGTLFGLSALLKLFDFAPFINLFDAALYPAMSRTLVGIVELLGAVLVLTRRFALAGALILFAVSIFAIVHVATLAGNPLPLVIGLALTGALIFIEGRLRLFH